MTLIFLEKQPISLRSPSDKFYALHRKVIITSVGSAGGGCAGLD
jgi:hypothetical protein